METDLGMDDVDVLGDRVATHGPFELTKTGVIVAGEPTFEEWEAAFTWAQQVEKASPFWVGDLIEYGEHRYGEKYAQALDSTTASYGTLANAAYVARNVQISRRRENLSFAVHQEVAPLPVSMSGSDTVAAIKISECPRSSPCVIPPSDRVHFQWA